MAASVTQLAWGAITFQDGYEMAGQLEYIKECIQWGTDYFIAAHISSDEFVAQIGDVTLDHDGYWGRAENMTEERPASTMSTSYPGSAVVGETAAALAAASIFYTNINETSMADEALTHARELFSLSNTWRSDSGYASISRISEVYGYNNYW